MTNDGGERDYTASLARFFGEHDGVLVGIGDDAAIVRNAAEATVVTCDPVVAGVHFSLETPWRAAGRKAILRNLSDITAMGARPDYAVISVLLPTATEHDQRDQLFEGLRDAAREHGCAVVGGDLGNTPGPLVVTVTICGHLEPGAQALRRDAACVGDMLHLTGPVGGAGVAGRHLEPIPRIGSGAWLAACPTVRAAIDVSDGLALDLATLCAASGVGAEIYASEVPVHADAARAAEQSGRSPLDHALGDGEDYELLFTCAGGGGARALDDPSSPLAPRSRRPFGRIVAEPGLWLIDAGGARTVLAPDGYQHGV